MNDENLENKKQKTEDRKEDKKYPKIIAGVFIFNEKNELLLIKAPRWHNKYTPIGGKVEIGETLVEAAKREAKEETNLDVEDIELIGIEDGLGLEESYKLDDNHFVFADYKAIARDIDKLKLNEEASSHKWLTIDEWLKKDESKFAPYTYDVLKKLKEGKDNFEHKPSDAEALEGKYKRALADYQNLLKQTAREKEEFAKFANERLIMEILPVYDHLALALKHANDTPSNANGVIEGIRHILNQFKSVLEGLGVEEIKTAGEKFDPNTMEAVSEEETENEKQDGIVERELSAGYKLRGKVIRAARVAVYRHITRNT